MSFRTRWNKRIESIKTGKGGNMDAFLPLVGRAALVVLGLAVMYLFATIEYTFLAITIPHIPAFRWIGLAFFSLGFPVWLIIFLHVAVGSDQHTIAKVMSWVSLVSAIFVSGYELAFGNATPTADIRSAAVLMVVITASANLVAYAVFHFQHPKYQLIRAANEIKDDINDSVEEQVKTDMKAEIPKIVKRETASIVSGIVNEYADQISPDRPKAQFSGSSNGHKEIREPEREADFTRARR